MCKWSETQLYSHEYGWCKLFLFHLCFTDFHDFYLHYFQYVYYHSILHLDQFIQPPVQEPSFFSFVGFITIETASSKSEFNPSLVRPEHSIYLSHLSDFARDVPWKDCLRFFLNSRKTRIAKFSSAHSTWRTSSSTGRTYRNCNNLFTSLGFIPIKSILWPSLKSI